MSILLFITIEIFLLCSFGFRTPTCGLYDDYYSRQGVVVIIDVVVIERVLIIRQASEITMLLFEVITKFDMPFNIITKQNYVNIV